MYLVYHSGSEAKWCKSKLDVIRHLCEIYGWEFEHVYERLWYILSKMYLFSVVRDMNLGLSIEKVSTGDTN